MSHLEEELDERAYVLSIYPYNLSKCLIREYLSYFTVESRKSLVINQESQTTFSNCHALQQWKSDASIKISGFESSKDSFYLRIH